jgi:ribulose-5-phosphate 4-epimerase/fuculose-1-phosphate aldolase
MCVHITTFRVNPFGLAFSQMTVSDLLLINPQGEIVMGGKPNRQVYNEVRPSVESLSCQLNYVWSTG